MFFASAILTSLYLRGVATLAAAPPKALPPDTTGISDAFQRLATLGVAIVGGVVIFFVVVNGYLYLTTSDDLQRGTHAKRAMGTLLIGAIIIILGGSIGNTIVKAILGP